jgi:heme/copper-type cytochrome/quinol oxidase subunit 2
MLIPLILIVGVLAFTSFYLLLKSHPVHQLLGQFLCLGFVSLFAMVGAFHPSQNQEMANMDGLIQALLVIVFIFAIILLVLMVRQIRAVSGPKRGKQHES